MAEVFNLWEIIGTLLIGVAIGYYHGKRKAYEEISSRGGSNG